MCNQDNQVKDNQDNQGNYKKHGYGWLLGYEKKVNFYKLLKIFDKIVTRLRLIIYVYNYMKLLYKYRNHVTLYINIYIWSLVMTNIYIFE